MVNHNTSHYCYKISGAELRALVGDAQAEQIEVFAKRRKAGKRAKATMFVLLNKAGTIAVQNVNFYGGENFGEPYHWLAEVTYTTTYSAFRRWAKRKLPALLQRTPFTY